MPWLATLHAVLQARGARALGYRDIRALVVARTCATRTPASMSLWRYASDAACAECGQPDTVLHRLLSCPRSTVARANLSPETHARLVRAASAPQEWQAKALSMALLASAPVEQMRVLGYAPPRAELDRVYVGMGGCDADMPPPPRSSTGPFYRLQLPRFTRHVPSGGLVGGRSG